MEGSDVCFAPVLTMKEARSIRTTRPAAPMSTSGLRAAGAGAALLAHQGGHQERRRQARPAHRRGAAAEGLFDQGDRQAGGGREARSDRLNNDCHPERSEGPFLLPQRSLGRRPRDDIAHDPRLRAGAPAARRSEAARVSGSRSRCRCAAGLHRPAGRWGLRRLPTSTSDGSTAYRLAGRGGGRGARPDAVPGELRHRDLGLHGAHRRHRRASTIPSSGGRAASRSGPDLDRAGFPGRGDRPQSPDAAVLHRGDLRGRLGRGAVLRHQRLADRPLYYEQVALRRRSPAEVKAWRRANPGVLWLTGIVIVFLGTIPVLNLIVPVLGTAAMVHVAKRSGRRLTLPTLSFARRRAKLADETGTWRVLRRFCSRAASSRRRAIR